MSAVGHAARARRWAWVAVALLAGLLAGSCGDDAGGPPCAGDEHCGEMCNDERPCPLGLYCADEGVCAQQCEAGKADACGKDQVCDATGMCVTGSFTTSATSEIARANAGTADAANRRPDTPLSTLR